MIRRTPGEVGVVARAASFGALGLAFVLASVPGAAQERAAAGDPDPEPFVVGSLGLVRVAGETGLDLTAGGGLLVGQRLVASALVDLSLRKADPDPRYRTETLSTGTNVCRDGETGRFAGPALCSPNDLLVAGLAELGWVVIGPSLPVTAGAGYRFGDAETAYAVVGYGPKRTRGRRRIWSVTLRAGDDFVSATVGIGLR